LRRDIHVDSSRRESTGSRGEFGAFRMREIRRES